MNETERDQAYNLIDRFMRNQLDDRDYAEYSSALELCFTDESLRQQLEVKQAALLRAIEGQEAAEERLRYALAVCKVKDERVTCILETKFSNWSHEAMQTLAREALSIQPDDSALRVWLGKPVALAFTAPTNSTATVGFDYTPELQRIIPRTGKSVPLYAPWGVE